METHCIQVTTGAQSVVREMPDRGLLLSLFVQCCQNWLGSSVHGPYLVTGKTRCSNFTTVLEGTGFHFFFCSEL